MVQHTSNYLITLIQLNNTLFLSALSVLYLVKISKTQIQSCFKVMLQQHAKQTRLGH